LCLSSSLYSFPPPLLFRAYHFPLCGVSFSYGAKGSEKDSWNETKERKE